jgi:aspartyl-tRNA(Asn)/glutamyl-tRNA(Gln) amidotransferase subunit A
LRVCVPQNFFFDQIDEQVEAAVRKAASALANEGAHVIETKIPDLYEATAAARVIQLCEAAALYAKFEDQELFGSDVWALIEQGRMIAGHDYVNAQRLRTVFRTAWNRLWESFDVLIAPTTPVAAPRRDQKTVTIGPLEEDARMASTRLTRAISFLGEPAISLPCGRTTEGLPVGLQIVAAPFADDLLLRTAAAVENLLFVS